MSIHHFNATGIVGEKLDHGTHIAGGKRLPEGLGTQHTVQIISTRVGDHASRDTACGQGERGALTVLNVVGAMSYS